MDDDRDYQHGDYTRLGCNHMRDSALKPWPDETTLLIEKVTAWSCALAGIWLVFGCWL